MAITTKFNKQEFERKREMVVIVNQKTKNIDRFICPTDLQLGIPDVPKSIKIFDGQPKDPVGRLYSVGGQLYFSGNRIAGGGGASNAFTTISSSGRTDIVADSSSDTLTFAAGTGIAITTDPATDTITITGNIGDITSVTAGTLLDGGNSTGDVTLNVDLTEAAGATITNGDYIIFLDSGTSGTHAKGDVADIATLFAGDGLASTSSVMRLDINELTIRTDLDPHTDYVAFSDENQSGDPSRKTLGVELARALVETEDVRVATQMFM